MGKSSRRRFVANTIAAGAAAFGAVPGRVLAGASHAGLQARAREKMNFVVEAGNIGSGSLEEAIQYAKDLGIPAMSVPWVRVQGFKETGVLDGDRLKAVRAQIEQAGLVFHSMMASIPREVLAGGAEADTRFAALRQNFQAMATARVDLLSAFAPARNDVPWDQLVGFYRRLMKDLEPTGVRFASHSGGAFITYAKMSQLLKDVPSPNNGFCFCTGNVWHGEGEKIYDIPPQLASRFFYVHMRSVKTGQGEKEFWFDEGDIDVPKMIGALRKVGYRGGIRSEHLPTDHYGQARESDVGTAWAQGYMRAVQQLM
jgi:sugar phosphate isomerase/epimerase